MRMTYELKEEPTGEIYHKLIDHALFECRFVLLVVRDSVRISESGQLILRKMKKFLKSKARGGEWPGTKLLSASKATLYKYELSWEVAEILKMAVRGLYDWVQPQRPEDLCLLRSDGTPWLASIAHEKDAYFTLSGEEKQRLIKVLPSLTRHRKTKIGGKNGGVPNGNAHP